ncbi:glycosyltransferase, group 1 family protein [delta proteobacterium NaphS2]|nr:glycosyltransferase, group 1 family protein [delta proteobacterium NaphS2]
MNIALLSHNQFDPFLRNGGCQDLMARLSFLKKQGNRTSIFNFLANDLHHKFFIDSPTDASDPGVFRQRNKGQAVLHGIDYYEEILPWNIDAEPDKRGPIVKTIVKSIQHLDIDYIITTDQDYYSLFVAWYLRIPGSHFFHSQVNVWGFSKNMCFTHFLKKRTVFTNSKFMRTQVKTLLNIDSEVWYPPINFDVYRVPRDESRTGRIGFCSGQEKGNAVVAEIVARMPENHFIIAGGRFPEHLLGRSQNVALLSFISDMKAFYGQIDLLLVPSVCEEAFGRVILEAAASGIPVIANQVGGIPEALGPSGVLIELEDLGSGILKETVNKYVTEIRRLLNDNDLYKFYTTKAFSWAKTYEREQTIRDHSIYGRYIK